MIVPRRIREESITDGNLKSLTTFLNVSKYPKILGVSGERRSLASSDCSDAELATIKSFARLKTSGSSH